MLRREVDVRRQIITAHQVIAAVTCCVLVLLCAQQCCGPVPTRLDARLSLDPVPAGDGRPATRYHRASTYPRRPESGW